MTDQHFDTIRTRDSKGETLVSLATLSHGVIDYASRTPGEYENTFFTSISLNAQDVQRGGVFAALPGLRAHGAEFFAEAQAGLILTDKTGQEIIRNAGEIETPVLVVEDVRAILGTVSAAIYGNPSDKLTIIGITGTSGKTTTSYMVEKILMARYSVGLIGTNGTRINGTPVPTSLTTPEAPKLQELFRTMVDQGVTHVVMEVSSHAIELGRIQGTRFSVVSFLNLSQDHLDFHPTMEEYFQAKAKLFSDYGAPVKIISIEDDWGYRLAQQHPESWTLCMQNHSELVSNNTFTLPKPWVAQDFAVEQLGKQSFNLKVGQNHRGSADSEINSETELEVGQKIPLSISMPGTFNILNASIAAQISSAVGIPMNEVREQLAHVQVPGRMEQVQLPHSEQDFLVLVDYAHKPGAVEAVLTTVRGHSSSNGGPRDGRVAIVLGAGGDRDHSKRGPMGNIAACLADTVIVTDDNPRSEDPEGIRESIIQGAYAGQQKNSSVEIKEISDRAEAIDTAIQWAQPSDIIIIAGKGHEKGQIVGNEILPFDDVEQAIISLQSRYPYSTEATPGEEREQ